MSELPNQRLTRRSRVLIGVVVAVVVVWLLFEFVFPWVESRWYNPAVGVVSSLT